MQTGFDLVSSFDIFAPTQCLQQEGPILVIGAQAMSSAFVEGRGG
jgi:hypothetical protein